MELSLRDWQPGHGGASSQPSNRFAVPANHLELSPLHEVDCATHDSTCPEDMANLTTRSRLLQPVEAAAAGTVALPHLHLHQPAAPAALRAVRGLQPDTLPRNMPAAVMLQPSTQMRECTSSAEQLVQAEAGVRV